jgi:excisionase family DNA binding protein
MMLTLGQAAKAANVSKSTLSRAIKEGRMSAIRRENGEYEIDPSELFRAYPAKPSEGVVPENGTSSNELLNNEIKKLRDRLRDKDQHIETLQGQVSDIQKDREHWRQQVTNLLEDQREKESVLTAHLTAEQELREQIAHDKAQHEQTAQRLEDMQSSIEKVRNSWIGRLFFKV